MLTPLLGIITLTAVMFVAFTERGGVKLSYLDYHAAAVVFGGVIGTLLVAIDRRSLIRMIKSVRELLPTTSAFSRQMRMTRSGIDSMAAAWREGRRGVVLELADSAPTLELRVAADALLRQLRSDSLAEPFARLRTQLIETHVPVIEGWEMVGKLAPSFGMVGTVSGMVQLFRNMGANTGNLGGAMAMALLATLYGIALGAAVGGPMAARVNTQLNDRLALLDLIEKTISALNHDKPASQAQ
jgi:chemotaxis protein MotA